MTRLARLPALAWWQSVLIGVVCAAVMLAVRQTFSILYGDIPGFMILLPGVIVAALAAGRVAGLTAVVTSLLGGWLALDVALSGPGMIDQLARVTTINFVIVGLFAAIVASAFRKIVKRLDASVVELKASESRATETESQLHAMVDQAAAGIARVGLDGRVVSGNARFAQIIGRTPDQIVGIKTSDVTHPDDIAPTQNALQAALAGGEGHVEKRYIHPDGTVVWAFTSLRALTSASGEVIGFVAVLVDITAAKSAEAALRESESRFRDIADTAPVLIWVTAQDRTRAFVNQAYVAYHGGSYEDARTGDWRDMIHPEDQEMILQQSLAGEATGRPFAMEARYRRADGAYRWLRSFSRPRLSTSGEVIGFVGVAFDITEPRQAEDDLKRINELLEDRVNQALAEKARAEADLMHAQRMEAIGRLTGGVAHDFNNLLTVVIGALDIILRSPDDAAKRKKLGEAALAAARRGEGLTHQLLAFSRRQTLRPQPVDLNAHILEGEPLLKRAVGEAVELRLRLRRGGAAVNVDVAQFEAALLNLVVNARHAVKDGGRIGIQTQSCVVQTGDVIDLPAGQYVCVSVSDNGAGMDADVMARVFEPFFTTKAVGKGTGLGLSQVYGFARQSGGAVRIRSKPGRGTQIKLYLPPLAEGMAIAVPETIAVATSVANRRLLLVEDDASVAAVALELLQDTGFEVRTAETAPQALDMLAGEAFDVMLSDIVMPGGMTGIELAQRVTRDYPAMKVVLTSGYAGDDVDEALKDAPWPFLRKPYSGEELARILGGSDDTTQS
ncbi:PAS domain S-box protein [uncultured Brevundimonas sp.]|uniref:hybrid sensor histidine kinase/response regulator n=1 Tax=uncultured Brevundimonas sp. TaxID=213418 RepID=UPI0025E67FF7|nr:PAS domain S-box protein [uncultured Brevundimonas sp.]